MFATWWRKASCANMQNIKVCKLCSTILCNSATIILQQLSIDVILSIFIEAISTILSSLSRSMDATNDCTDNCPSRVRQCMADRSFMETATPGLKGVSGQYPCLTKAMCSFSSNVWCSTEDEWVRPLKNKKSVHSKLH